MNLQIWWVAGGAASFWRGYTNHYTDVDLYICCSGMFKNPCPTMYKNMALSTSPNYLAHAVKILNMTATNEDILPIQVIFVKFPVPQLQPPKGSFLDFFAIYVPSTFDMPVCRVAIRFPLKTDNRQFLYIDITGKSTTFRTIHASRLAKYNDRRLQHVPFEIPRLGVKIIFDYITA